MHYEKYYICSTKFILKILFYKVFSEIFGNLILFHKKVCYSKMYVMKYISMSSG